MLGLVRTVEYAHGQSILGAVEIVEYNLEAMCSGFYRSWSMLIRCGATILETLVYVHGMVYGVTCRD